MDKRIRGRCFEHLELEFCYCLGFRILILEFAERSEAYNNA